MEKNLQEKGEIENFDKKMIVQYNHKTLEERAAEFDGKLKLDGEYDCGDAVGREVW